MCDMEQQTLPLPNPKDWMTRAAAAAALSVDPRTIDRMVTDQLLKAYQPVVALHEGPRPLFWAAEVMELGYARDRAMRRVRA
jgi:hypothetical protein